MCKELGRLAQGYWYIIKGTNTLHFLFPEEIKLIPKDKTITYARIVVDVRPQKTDPNRVRLTVGGNLIKIPGDISTATADLITIKILWNSVSSTPNAKYACIDIKDMYLQTPLKDPQYMKSHAR